MRINYVTRMDDTLASFRYRMQIPARQLEKWGHETFVTGYLYSGCPSVVFSKHFSYDDAKLAKNAKEAGRRVIFDICDNHLDGSPHEEHYRRMIDLADEIVCSTPELAEVVADRVGRASVVITDPYELDEMTPILPSLGEKSKLLWYGHQTNLGGLNAIWPDLDGQMVMVISNPEASQWMKHPVVAWSHEAVKKGLFECDAVIIPVADTERGRVKSPNRMVEAIRRGRFVIAHPLPAYEQFREWMWLGDIKEGIEWFRANLHEVPAKISAAQAYVRETFSPEKIAMDWEKVLVPR